MRLLIVTLLFVVYNLDARAQSHALYCGKADSTAAMMDCVKNHHDAAQSDLNDAYEALSATVQGEDLKILQDLQESWLEYRNQECGWERARVETNALTRLYQLSCEARMSQNRTDILSASFKNEDFKNQVEFSGFPRWMNALTKDHADVFWRVGGRERIDLNCDGQDEIVLAGAAIARNQLLNNKQNENSDQQGGQADEGTRYEPYAMDGVVAVLNNPDVTGRPDSHVFRLAVGEGIEGLHLCSPVLTVIPRPHDREKDGETNDGVESADDAAAQPQTHKTCNAHIVLKNKNCPALTLRWDGKDYALKPQAIGGAGSEKLESKK